MKKFLLYTIIIIGAVFLAILLAINISRPKSSSPYVDLPLFEYKLGYIDIGGIRYVPNQFDWKVDQRGERIGYIKDDNGIIDKRFFTFFYHGLYEIKDDSGEKFYFPHDMFADMEYKMLVSEKINLGYPTVETCGKIQTPSGEIITDTDIIKDFFHYTQGASTLPDGEIIIKNGYNFRIFHNKYSSIFNEAHLIEIEKDGSFWMEAFDGKTRGYMQVPKEFVMKLGIVSEN
jgi:hypothetical protein